MKTIICFIILLVQINFLSAQVKPKTTTKKSTTPAMAEIDRLYEKYKDSEYKEITLYTTYGELKGFVQINLNDDEKPQAIIIYGTSKNIDAVTQFVYDMVRQKEAKGYVSDDGAISYTGGSFERIKHDINQPKIFDFYPKYYFEKGKMYTKITAFCNNCDVLKSNTDIINYEFEIETGDRSRLGGKKAEKLDF